jgi:hypothetical protein
MVRAVQARGKIFLVGLPASFHQWIRRDVVQPRITRTTRK